MKLKLIVLAPVLLATLFLARAEASTLTYDFALNATSGPESGTVSFTINCTTGCPKATSGLTNYTAGSGLSYLDFSIAGSNFTLADELSKANVTFDNGNLINIAYLGALNGFKLDLGSIGLNYAFVDLLNSSLDSFGSISASPVSEAPLPPSWTLMLIGLAGFGFMAYRRKMQLAPG
jgi:hypothetical protein